MALTAEQEALRNRLNQDAVAAHREASEKAIRAGRQPPPAPLPLTAEQIEFPKYLYNGKGEAKLVKSAVEQASAGPEWAESPSKAKEAKEVAKK